MGLTVNDTITLDSGLPVTGTYLSFNGGQVITIEYGVSCALKATLSTITNSPSANIASTPEAPGDPHANVCYTISGTYSLWASKDAKDRGLKPLQTFRADYGLTKDQINQPPLDLLYEYVKTIYKNTVDDT